jgi:hypothetical protein
VTSTNEAIAVAIAAGKIQQRARKLGDGVAAIEQAYRSLVKATHPDVGGDAAEFRALTAARDQLMKRAAALHLAFHAVPGTEPPKPESLN